MGIIFSILVLMSSCKNESRPVQIDDTKEIENDTVYYDKIEKEVEKDGSFVWYRYKIKEEVGALDLNRQIIIPAKYESCYYDEHFDKFHVARNDSAGLYNLDGTSFIDISRGYANFMKEQLTNGNYYILFTGMMITRNGIWMDYAMQQVKKYYQCNSFRLIMAA